MKSNKIFLTLIFGFCFFDLLLPNLIDVYKTGEVKLIPVPGFGQDIDWDDPSFYKFSSITVSLDGCIFAAISKQHKIFKFDRDGKILFKFGQKGQGPADLLSPGNLSILDNKYLVVCEYALNRRISIFDLKGNFVKIIRTSYPVYSAIALKNNKIAILTNIYLQKSRKTSIFIKDISNNVEKKIAESTDELRIVYTSNNVLIDKTLQGEGFIRKTLEGNLLLGFSYDNSIKVYSPEGELIRSFKLKSAPIRVDSSVINRYIKSRIENIKRNFKNPETPLKEFKAASNKVNKLFYDYLPFYSNIIVDDQNYILIFKFLFSHEGDSLEFQVYSPDGYYICNSRINFSALNYIFNPEDFNNEILVFYDEHIFIILDIKNGDDIQRKIIKSRFQKDLTYKENNKQEVFHDKSTKFN